MNTLRSLERFLSYLGVGERVLIRRILRSQADARVERARLLKKVQSSYTLGQSRTNSGLLG